MSWEPILLAAVVWWATGMTAASLLYRRGHDGGHWFVACGLAGPLALLLVADQARFVEPAARPATLRAVQDAEGVTVVVPIGAVGWLRPHAQAWLGSAGKVVVAAAVPFERAGTGPPGLDLTSACDAAAERFPGAPVEVVSLPGRLPDALVSCAAERAPSLIVTAREAHPSGTIARIARLAAAHPGVALLITDRAAVPAEIA